MLLKVDVHLEGVPEHVRLVSGALLEALVQGTVVAAAGRRSVGALHQQPWARLACDSLFLELLPVIRVRALLDDHESTLTRRKAAHVGQTLLSHNDVEVVLGCESVRRQAPDAKTRRAGHTLVDMTRKGHDAGDTGRVRLARPTTGA